MSPREALVTASIRSRLDSVYRNFVRFVVVADGWSQGDRSRAAWHKRPARLPIAREVPRAGRRIVLTAERRECLSLRHQLAGGLDEEEHEPNHRPKNHDRDPNGLHMTSLVLVGHAVEGLSERTSSRGCEAVAIPAAVVLVRLSCSQGALRTHFTWTESQEGGAAVARRRGHVSNAGRRCSRVRPYVA